MRSQRKAFTLIELLVVVAIIALLVALLLPALGRARMISVRTACLASIRATALGMHLYAADNTDDIIVSYQPPGGHYHTWGGTIVYGYDCGDSSTQDKRIQPSYVNPRNARCPLSPNYAKIVATEPPASWSNGPCDLTTWTTYAVFIVNSSKDPKDWNFTHHYIFDPVGDPNGYNWWLDTQRLTRIPNPGSMIMLAESLNVLQANAHQAGPQWGTNSGYFYFGNCGIWTAHGWSGDPNYTGATTNGFPVADANYVGGMANVAYYDAHAESLSVQNLRNGTQQCHYFWDRDGPNKTSGFWVK